jgi:hypothetical protein
MSVEFEQLVDKRKAKSDVWKHFGFLANAHGVITDKKKIICWLCKVAIAYSGHTSNLTYHLQRIHPRELAELHKDAEDDKACPSSNAVVTKQLTLPRTIVRATPFPRDGTKHKQLVDAVADFICLGLQSLSVVDDTSFRHLLEIAEPQFQLPHRTHFTDKIIPAKYRTLTTSPSPSTASIGRSRRSPVWDYFVFDKGTEKSICQVRVPLTADEQGAEAAVTREKVCGHAIVGKYPTNLRQHLKKAHSAEFKDVVKKEVKSTAKVKNL